MFNDWIQETLHDLESYVPNEAEEAQHIKEATRKHSSQILMNAEVQIQAQMQAQMKAQQIAQQARIKQKEKEEIDQLANQLDAMQEDDDLLAGLQELENKEKVEIDRVKKVSTKEVGIEQGQGSATIAPKEEDEPSSSSFGLIGVAAALALAGGLYAYRQSLRR